MKTRIFKAFLTVIALLTISEAFCLTVHSVMVKKHEQVLDTLVSEYQLSRKSTDLVNSFYDLIQYSNDAQRNEVFKGNLESLSGLLGKLDKDLSNSDSWPVYLGAKNTINTLIADVTKGVGDNLAGNFSEVTADYLKATNDNIFVRENTGNLLLKELENVEKQQADMDRVKFWSDLFGIALFVLVGLGCGLYAWSFAKNISSSASATKPKSKLPEVVDVAADDARGEQ
jgi:hypothetical protein